MSIIAPGPNGPVAALVARTIGVVVVGLVEFTILAAVMERLPPAPVAFN